MYVSNSIASRLRTAVVETMNRSVDGTNIHIGKSPARDQGSTSNGPDDNASETISTNAKSTQAQDESPYLKDADLCGQFMDAEEDIDDVDYSYRATLTTHSTTGDCATPHAAAFPWFQRAFMMDKFADPGPEVDPFHFPFEAPQPTEDHRLSCEESSRAAVERTMAPPLTARTSAAVAQHRNEIRCSALVRQATDVFKSVAPGHRGLSFVDEKRLRQHWLHQEADIRQVISDLRAPAVMSALLPNPMGSLLLKEESLGSSLVGGETPPLAEAALRDSSSEGCSNPCTNWLGGPSTASKTSTAATPPFSMTTAPTNSRSRSVPPPATAADTTNLLSGGYSNSVAKPDCMVELTNLFQVMVLSDLPSQLHSVTFLSPLAFLPSPTTPAPPSAAAFSPSVAATSAPAVTQASMTPCQAVKNSTNKGKNNNTTPLRKVSDSSKKISGKKLRKPKNCAAAATSMASHCGEQDVYGDGYDIQEQTDGMASRSPTDGRPSFPIKAPRTYDLSPKSDLPPKPAGGDNPVLEEDNNTAAAAVRGLPSWITVRPSSHFSGRSVAKDAKNPVGAGAVAAATATATAEKENVPTSLELVPSKHARTARRVTQGTGMTMAVLMGGDNTMFDEGPRSIAEQQDDYGYYDVESEVQTNGTASTRAATTTIESMGAVQTKRNLVAEDLSDETEEASDEGRTLIAAGRVVNPEPDEVDSVITLPSPFADQKFLQNESSTSRPAYHLGPEDEGSFVVLNEGLRVGHPLTTTIQVVDVQHQAGNLRYKMAGQQTPTYESRLSRVHIEPMPDNLRPKPTHKSNKQG